MENIKIQYKELIEKRNNIRQELQQLQENEIVKRYLELEDELESSEEEEKTLYAKMKEIDYNTCKHITIYTKVYQDACEGKTYRNVGCLKCGADTFVLDYPTEYLSLEEKAMYKYLKSYSNVLFNSKPKYTCDLSLAAAIYRKIKENNPKIDDKTAIKYFEIALDNIRNIKVSEERKQSRAKRLGLKKNFKKWYAKDVEED